MKYSELLRDPRWQRKRLEVMQAADFACETCGDRETTLNVHHPRYVKGRKPWEYEASELQCLCEPCHKQRHSNGGAVPVVERTITLVGGPCAGTTIRSAHKLPLVWVYEKQGQIITAEDMQQVVVVGGREAASHFFGRGHPYMYASMYGPEKQAEFQQLWKAPYPVLVGVYGLIGPGSWVDMWGPAARKNELAFGDPDVLLLHIDSLFSLVGLEFDEAAYWAE